MAEAEVSIIIKAIDEFSAVFSKAESATKNLKGTLVGIGVVAGAAFAATSAAIYKSVNDFTEFNNSMQKAGANVNATGDELEAYKEQVLSISRDTKISGQEAARVFEMLAGGVVSAEDAMTSLDDTIRFARANQLSYEDAIGITNQALTLFKLEGDDVTRGLDILTRTSGQTSQKQIDLAMAMQEAGPSAAGLGINLLDLSTILGGLGDAGVKGSEAGVALKRTLDILVAPSKGAQDALDRLNISTDDIKNNISKPIDLLKIFEDRLSSIQNPMDKAAILSDIFGQVAGPKMSLLLMQGTGALDTIKSKIEDSSGATKQLTDIVDDSRAPWTILGDELRTVIIPVGGEIIKILQDLMKVIMPIVKGITEWIRLHPKLAAGILIAVAALSALVIAVVAVAGAVMFFQAVAWPVTLVVLAIAATIAALIAIGVYLWKQWDEMSWVVKGLAIAFFPFLAIPIMIIKNWTPIKEFFIGLWGSIKEIFWKVISWIVDINFKVSRWLIEQWFKFKDMWEVIWALTKNIAFAAWNAMLDYIQKSVNKYIDMINWIIEAMNKIPGVNIPLIPKVDLGQFKAELEDINALIKKQELERFEYLESFDTSADAIRQSLQGKIGREEASGGNTEINITGNNYGTDPDEIAGAITDKLKNKISI